VKGNHRFDAVLPDRRHIRVVLDLRTNPP